MTIEELQKGEHETIEYKQDIPKDKDKFLKTAVAFANAAGGRLVFGVENNTWKVLGFSDEEVFQKYDAIANGIFDACTPSVVPVMEIEEIDGKKIIVANILPGMAKPYYLRKDGMMDGTYIRVAGVTRKAEPYMIKELQLEGTNTSFDSLQVVGDALSLSEINALCERMYQHALFLCKNDEQRRTQKKVTVSQLVSWKVLVQFQENYYPTNAWKLLRGEQEDLLPDAFIQLGAFKGTSRAVFLDKQEAKGPIDQQVEDALLFVKRHINLGSRIAGVYREDYYELPMDSVREIISNAVCHRSYLSPGSIQVAIYDDRLEVTSPGRLSPDLTIDQLIEGNSRVKNVAIGAAFQYMHVIEKWGTGIPRVFQEAEAYGLKDPEIKDFGTSFRIILYRKPFETDPYGVIDPSVQGEKTGGSREKPAVQGEKTGGLGENPAVGESQAAENFSLEEQKSVDRMMEICNRSLSEKEKKRILPIVEHLKMHETITREEAEILTGKSLSTVTRYLNRMIELDMLVSEGQSVSTVYKKKQ